MQVRRFLHMSWLNFKGQRAAFNFEEFILLETLYPLMTMIFYCVMAGYAFQTSDVTEWVIGNSFLLCVNVCIFSLGTSFVSERHFGRIRSIITAPISKIEVVLEKGFFACLASILTTAVGFAAGGWIFKLEWGKIPWGPFVFALVIAMFAATAFGLFLSAIGLVSTQMHLILNTVNYILLIFCGTNFPIEQLPKAGQFLSYLLPLTKSLKGIRGLMSREFTFEQFLIYMLGECITGLVYVLLAVAVIRFAEKVAVKKGTLELF